MSHLDHYGDADVEDAVAEIMNLGSAVFDPEGGRKDVRSNKESQDITEAQHSTDLEESEREERAGAKDDAKAEKAGDEGDEKAEEEAAGADEEQFIELPPAEEGAEPLRVPVAEAAEAVLKMRQLDGDIATAVIRAETEAHDKQDKITQGMMQAFDAVIKSAETTLRAMQAYAPQPPDPIMLDRNGGYYDPEGYHIAKINYDGWVQHAQKIAHDLDQANKGKTATTSFAETEMSKRELERTARYIPEFAKDDTREAKKADILKTLAKYGLSKEDMDDVSDHRAWRLMHDYAQLLKTQTKAPEVRKHVQETKARITKGRAMPDRAKDGKFIGDAFKELKDTGTTDAAAKLLMRSGVLKGF